MLRVGHGGAGALVRANTLASFDAALELGVDMIEFDVRACRGQLLLAHTPLDARLRPCPTLRAALEHLRGPRFADLRFDVDVKTPGAEAALLDELRASGLRDRTLVSSRSAEVLRRVRMLDPRVRIGISVRRRQGRPRVLAALEQHRVDAVMAHHKLCDTALVAGVRERAGELFAWTVDERARLDALRGAGVSGVISNDPRLFQPVVA
jgi:glycerophosphoryl diester phosphodiesterase